MNVPACTAAPPPVLRGAWCCLSLVLCLLSAVPAGARSPSPAVLDAVVGVRAQVPPSARTAAALGTERTGTGVVIDGDGLVLTIGYLIMESSRVDLLLDDGREVPARVVAYDHESGFGLVRALGTVDRPVMPLGESSDLAAGTPVLVASHEGESPVRGAVVVSRREFAGYWEYLLDEAIFTAPAHPSFGGAALVDSEGRLVGIGSLAVSDAVPGRGHAPGNMFVPVDILKPILADLLLGRRSTRPPRPWVGVYTEEVRGHVVVTRVARESPAQTAGIASGDIIVRVAGVAVDSMAAFYRAMWRQGAAGVDIPLTVLKGARLADITVTSGDRYAWLRLSPAY